MLSRGMRFGVQADAAEKRKETTLIDGPELRINVLGVKEPPRALQRNLTIQTEHAGTARGPVADDNPPLLRSDMDVRKAPSLAAHGASACAPRWPKTPHNTAEELPGHEQVAPHAGRVCVPPSLRVREQVQNK